MNTESEYITAFQNFLNKTDEIVDWKHNRGLEEAKLLSINLEFHKDLNEIRKRWNIKPQFNKDIFQPWAVLEYFTSHLSDEDKKLLNEDLRNLGKKFNLDWSINYETDDFGLIVAALCFGITPDIILNHWDKIKYTVASTRTPGIRVFIDSHPHIKEKLINMTVIGYLFFELWKAGIKIEIPASVRDVLLPVLKELGKIDAERAEKLIQTFQEAEIPVDLYLKIEPNTTLEDVKRTWQQVELRKVEVLQGKSKGNKSKKRRRIWRTYPRDIFIWRRVNQGKITYDNAYNEWLSTHPEEEPVEITAVIKAVNRIKELPEEN